MAPDTELSITFVDNNRIQEINREYRNKDQATDVISFALNDDMDDDFPINMESISGLFPTNIGDIIISTEKTLEQAGVLWSQFRKRTGFLALHEPLCI